MTYERKKIIAACLFVAAYASLALLAAFDKRGFLLGGQEDSLATFFFTFLVLLWGITIIYRVQSPTQRNVLIALFLITFFWLILRFVKWLPNVPLVTMYSDYAFYVPITVTPVLLLVFATETFFPALPHKNTLYLVVFSLAFLFVSFAFTNSLHSLVYRDYGFFYPDNENPNSYIVTYSYGTVHYAAMAFIGATLLLSVVFLVRGAIRQIKFSHTLLPILITLLGVAYFVAYAIGVPFLRTTVFLRDFALVSVVLLHALLESLMAVGLVQNNGKYVSNFRRSALPMRIFDENGSPLYKGEKFDEKKYAERDPGTRFTVRSVGMYSVVVEEDLSELYALREKLRAENKELSETNALLANALQVRAQQAAVAYRLELADEIERGMGTSRKKLSALLSSLPDETTPDNESHVKRTLGRIAFLIGYMKQKCMLLLGAKENKFLTPDAFRLFLDVISRDARSVGFGDVAYALSPCTEIPVSTALLTNELFEQIAEVYAFSGANLLLLVNPDEKRVVVEADGVSLLPDLAVGKTPVTVSQVEGAVVRIVMEVAE